VRRVGKLVTNFIVLVIVGIFSMSVVTYIIFAHTMYDVQLTDIIMILFAIAAYATGYSHGKIKNSE